MREQIEFRIPETHAQEILDPRDGVVLGGSVRKIELSVDDPRLALIEEAELEFAARGDAFFTSWNITRSYSSSELDEAELFHLLFTRTFEPAGSECGTRYSDSAACALCGAGERQIGYLRLDLGRLPRSADLARSIADEWVASQRLAEVVAQSGLTGVALEPVLHRDGPPEQVDPSAHRGWKQLTWTAAPVSLAPTTRFGIHPFDDDPEGRYRCPLGHVAGLNLLSEIRIQRSDRPETDFAITHELVGDRRGLLRPAPLLLITQDVRRVLVENNARGYRLERVQLLHD